MEERESLFYLSKSLQHSLKGYNNTKYCDNIHLKQNNCMNCQKVAKELMMMKKKAILFAYIVFVLLLFIFNSIEIVHWFNKSLFDHFEMDIEHINSSFYNGVSLIFIITIIFYSLFGTAIGGLIVADLLFIGLIVANYYKVTERSEYLTFTELKTIIYPQEILSFISVTIPIAIVAGILLLTILYIFLHFIRKWEFKRNLLLNKKMRLGIFILAAALLISIFMKPNEYNNKILQFETETTHNFNPVKQAQQDGFIPTFIDTVKPHYMQKPKGYKKKNMEQIYEKYSKTSQQVNEDRDDPIDQSKIILYLSESLMDPKLVPDLLENESPLPEIEKIIDKNVGGTMYSQFMGGGTANLEWSLLTSFSTEVFDQPLVTTPYSDFYLDSKNHHTILDLTQKKNVALHPYTANLYNRQEIYEAIGMDKFLYVNHGIRHEKKLGEMIRISDASLNKDIFRVLDKKDVGLLHVLSMQNHAPYKKEVEEVDYEPQINEDVYPKEKREELINYLQAIKASDKAVKKLTDRIDDEKNDVNLILYGDHFPRLFEGMENEFGEDHIHETPWFLYMNHQGASTDKNIEGVSPIFFVPILLREGDYYVTPYYALMDELFDEDVLRIGKDFVVTKEGEVADEDLSEDLRDMVEDYRLIQYDALFGEDWLPKDFYTEYKN